MKTFYLPAIQEQLNHDTILSDIIDTNEKDVSGKNATIQCHYGRNTGTGARADGGVMPTAGYQKFKTCTVPMKYNYGRVQFTGPTIAATRDAQGSYARVVDTEITGVVTDLKKEVNRQLWGAGYGTLARWQSGATTSIVLQNAYTGNSAGGNGFGSAFGAKYFEENSNGVAVVIASAGASGTATVDDTDLAVSAVSKASTGDTITCTDVGVTEAAGTFYVRGDANAQSLGTITTSGGHRREMMGLRGIVADTDLDEIAVTSDAETTCGLATANNDSLQGLAVATYTWWKGLVSKHSSGRYAGQRTLTLMLMQQMFDAVEKKAGKDYGPNLILTTRAIRREYLELCTADRRVVNTMTLDGGWTALDYNGIPLTVDDDAIDGEMYFLTS
ncbi:MAG: phage major capsid protein, partial [archaeon]